MSKLLDMTVTQIARGLVVRSDNRGYDWVKRMLSLFPDDHLGRHAARALGVIGGDDSDELLSKRNHAVVKVRCLVCR